MAESLTDEESFKRALRCWASGVAIVTASDSHGHRGMTVSSLCSVSLEPPLISVCFELEARTLVTVRSTGKFAVSILSLDQADLSNRFASKSLEDVRFEGQRFALGDNGCPLLDGAAAHLECSVHATHPAGDHQLVLGAVTRALAFPRPPLLYFDGSYRELENSGGV